jgi:hypothetical protein
MPKGPKGEKRPADMIGNAVLVMRIATGQLEEKTAHPGHSKGGKKGARGRAKVLSPQQRSEIARAAASARWKKN